MVEVQVGEMEAGKKMHRLLRQLLPGVPLSGVHKMLRTGRVKKNGKRTFANDVAASGDVLQLYMSEADYALVSKPVKKFAGIDGRIDILYEDKDIIIVNKPAGKLIHGANGEQKDTLVNDVMAYLHRNGMDIRAFAPAPVHRLDRNTSGIVIFAKNGPAARSLSGNIARHEIRKWYLAIVRGTVPSHGIIDQPIFRDPSSNRTKVSAEGKPAKTLYYRISECSSETAVVLVELISGRTHQIRAHFESIGHPLYGDTKYGGGRSRKGDAHQWLHAGWMQLPDGRVFHAPLSSEFQDQLRRIGCNSGLLDKIANLQPEEIFGTAP